MHRRPQTKRFDGIPAKPDYPNASFPLAFGGNPASLERRVATLLWRGFLGLLLNPLHDLSGSQLRTSSFPQRFWAGIQRL